MSKKTSITDLPKNASEKDSFGIEPYEKGLIRFIKNTNTPITIALQGEWGSGKTSLMNSLKKNLSDSENSEYHSVWLNTWEYSLMKSAQSTLMDIISDLIRETSKIANVDETKTKKLLKSLWGGIKDTSKVVAKNALDNTISGAGTVVDSFSSSGKTTIGDIRNELEKIIEENIKKTNKKGFIFFIDDLDRVDPSVAVELLELLKNIFTLKNCIFILAIDYDVVVKGLEPKFGKLTVANEREFRSFFDKIIQVPFSMPVSAYTINDFIIDSFLTTDYLKSEQVRNEELINDFAEISLLTVGTNPRALKRLMNSLSLISCINIEKVNEQEQLKNELELLVNYAMVSIQIAYPPIYRLLSNNPGFDSWNESVAIQMNLPELDDDIKRKLAETKEFDDEWEQIIYRLAETDPYLKKRALNISRLLNKIKNIITEKGEDIENTIESVISLSSVTNMESIEAKEVIYHKGHFLKNLRSHIIDRLKQKLPQVANTIQPQGTRVQTNAFIKFTDNNWEQWIKLFSHPHQGKIRLIISTEKWVGRVISNYNEDWKKTGADKKIHQLFIDFENLQKDFEPMETLTVEESYEEIRKIKNHYGVSLYGYLTKENTDDFFDNDTLELLSNFIAKFYEFMIKLTEIAVEHDEKIRMMK